MKKMRQAHLWIGLITSILLLIQAVTGLLLTEPWLIGQQSRERSAFMQNMEQGQLPASSTQQGHSSPSTTQEGSASAGTMAQQNGSSGIGLEQGRFGPREGFHGEEGSNSLVGIIRGLHEGRLGTIDITWAIDIAAISMIFLTLSGIYLSVKLLLAQRRSRKKRTLNVAEG
ncbi:PepSY-associated TM helix domain-containing protein [Thermaerobacillus caldiproteolyticus]|uniref:PepSY-associated TM helix domain-containing protein n=1 Tax=Thermaerobacillus caldiproteolyticus TaxID=247480 RepID=UPI00188C2C32|nr:PepSY domain-containing protein [Anoxybacillus caldiproteolyticus]